MKRYNKILLCLLLPLVVLFIAKPVIAEPVEIDNLTYPELVEVYTKFYGGDVILNKSIIECESEWSPNAVGDGGRSNGIFQFQEASFYRMAKDLGEELNYNSPEDQIKLGVWAINNGYAREWTSYRAIKNGGKYTFYSKQLQKTFTVYCSLR